MNASKCYKCIGKGRRIKRGEQGRKETGEIKERVSGKHLVRKEREGRRKWLRDEKGAYSISRLHSLYTAYLLTISKRYKTQTARYSYGSD